MINSYAYDIEVLPNFFSITIVNVNDYLKTFADCADSKNKPVPLIKKHTVKDIIEKLNKVDKRLFYITDTDDSQLLSMLGYLNSMRAHYVDNKAVRSDMFGYNSNKYDKLMVAGLLMYAGQTKNTKELITKLYELSKHIIDLQDNPELIKHDYVISMLSKYSLPFVNVDVMTIFALNKVGKAKNDKGENVYFGKSLKQTSINLQWYELLEHELPPISDKDISYYSKIPKYANIPADKLNKLIDKWDRYIIDEWISDVMHYNCNDVYIVCEIIRLYIDEIRLRYNISKVYEIDVLSSSRSNIADKLFIKFYSEFSGLAESQWRGRKTERKALSFKKVILPFIEFETPVLQQMLADMKKVVIYSVSKDSFQKQITFGNLTYTIATGGLHSQDLPNELRSKIEWINPFTGSLTSEASDSIWANMTDDSYVYIHADVSSFYPSLMSVYKIAPAHMNEGVFVKLITWLRETRVQAKHSTEQFIDGIPKDVLAQVLKIVINSIYGKMGFEKGDICDRLAVLKVTINGQLLLLKLCETLELNGIPVYSANTDGIVVKVYKSKKDVYDKIIKEWCDYTKLSLDSEEYKCYINRDINNYVVEELNGKVSYKGALNPNMYAVDLQKGYDMPIVAQAVINYFLYNKPILETLYECKNILDFCKTQNVGKQFHVELSKGTNSYVLQRNVRFYVTNKNGGMIYKVHNVTGVRNGLCAGKQVQILNTLDDKRIELRNINYSYYLQEAIKIIDPIKLHISPNQKPNTLAGVKSGKLLLKKRSGEYNSLFDDNDF